MFLAFIPANNRVSRLAALVAAIEAKLIDNNPIIVEAFNSVFFIVILNILKVIFVVENF
jgi:hypothetical protein